MAHRAILSEREKSLADAVFLSALSTETFSDVANTQTANVSAQLYSGAAIDFTCTRQTAFVLARTWSRSIEELAANKRDVICIRGAIAPPSVNRVLAEYGASESDAVQKFVSGAGQIEDLLLEARPVIRRIFGATNEVSLELVHEPETPGHVELFALIHVTMQPEEALRRLDAFDQEWWLTAVRRANGQLNFTLRYD